MQDVRTQDKGFSEAEKEAMRARAKEVAAEAKMNKNKAQGEAAVQEAIRAMTEPDRSKAQRIHKLVTENTDLFPKTWYGMPAYAKNGKVVCFFQAASKFDSRYPTLGFTDSANLDDGHMWPVAFGVDKLTETEESQILKLLKKALS